MRAEMASVSKQVIVVLGMHRSGTSVVTRGLQVLGVDVGQNLLPPQPDNPKGFWEDANIVAFNDRVLSAFNMTWDSIGPIGENSWKYAELDSVRADAINYLRNTFTGKRVWGFKDPRTARALPFWQTIIKELGIEDKYVFVIRNPISIAKSLEKRNGIPAEKSHLLWIDHAISSVSFTMGKPFIVVNYDSLMTTPEEQINRLARLLELKTGERLKTEIEKFSRNYVTTTLRHSFYHDEDLQLDPATFALSRKTYEIMRDVAADQIQIGDQEFVKRWTPIAESYQDLHPLLNYLERTCKQNAAMVASNQEDQSHLIQAKASVSEQKNRIDELQHQQTERDRQLASQGEAIAQRDQQLATLHQTLGERSGRIDELQHQLQRDQRLRTLTSMTSEKDSQLAVNQNEITKLNEVILERDIELANLRKLVNERERELRSMKNSASWRLTSVVRFLETSLRRPKK